MSAVDGELNGLIGDGAVEVVPGMDLYFLGHRQWGLPRVYPTPSAVPIDAPAAIN